MQIIFNFLATSGIALLDMWVKKNAKNKEMIDSYYNFLKQVEKNGSLKVSNYLASEDLLKQKQDELKQKNSVTFKP